MIVSSCSRNGFEEYGKRFIEGFLKYWPDERLTFYIEGQDKSALSEQYPSVVFHDLLEFHDFRQFEKLIAASDPLFSGRFRDPHSGKETYNFRYDANKFFRKVFAVTEYDLAEKIACGEREPFAWLDADIVFRKELPERFLTETLADHAIAYLGRSGMYSETGFIAWDPRKNTHDDFMRLYRAVYLNGAFSMLTEWHDCQVFDFVRVMLECKSRNLAKGCDPNHPFVYSVLGNYMDHLKGPERKAAGKSPESQHVA